MNLYNVSSVVGPSLFCPQPCILATFFLDALSVDAPSQLDSAVSKKATQQLSSIGVSLDFLEMSDSVTGVVGLVKELVDKLMLDHDLSCGATVITEAGDETVFVAFAEKDRMLTMRVVNRAIKFIVGLYAVENSNADGSGVDFLLELKQLLNSTGGLSKSRASQCMQDSLRSENKPWFSLDVDMQEKNVFQVGFGRQQQLMRGTVSFESSHLGVQASHSKIKTLQFLSEFGFPVPQQVTVMGLEQTRNVAEKMRYPVVLKAEFGTRGSHVYADLRDAEELTDAFRALHATLPNKNISLVVEKNIPGNVYRVEVVKGKFFDAYEMIPAGISGDGERSVRELVDLENSHPSRKPKTDPTGTFVSLELGASELLTLKKQGLTPSSIPADGQAIRLSSTSNWSKGGTYKNISDLVHNDNKQLVERLAAVLKIDLIGVDLISEGIERSFLDSSLKVLEVNHAPDMGNYYDITSNKFINVSKRIVERLAPNVNYGDVPVIAVKSSELAQRSEELLADRLNAAGYSAGLINKKGVVIDGQRWATSDQLDVTSPGLALLRNDAVGAAIVDHLPKNLADFGLGYGGCDIAVILNAKSGNIISTRWPQGVSSETIDKFLIETARLARIICVEDDQGVDLCLLASEQNTAQEVSQSESGNNYALLINDALSIKKLIAAGVNCIQLMGQTETSLQLRISQQGKSSELEVEVEKEDSPLPRMVVLAASLILNI